MTRRPEDIKEELQGDGFLKELKERHYESVESTSSLAIKKFEENNQSITPEYLEEHFSEAIIGLIGYETDIFESRHNEVYPKALVHFLEDYYKSGQTSVSSYGDYGEPELTEYSAIRDSFRNIEQEFNTHDDFSKLFKRVLPDIYYLIEPIVQSAGQSGSKRAGEAFRQQFINLIDIYGYNIQDQTMKGSGYVYSISQEDGHLSKEIYFGFHTTLRDRFRASLSEVKEGIPHYLVTASGANAISEDDSEDVTKDRLNEISRSEAKLITIDDVANGFPHHKAIISFEEFILESLPSQF